MSPLDLSFSLPDSYLIGALVGLPWTSIIAALVLLVVELVCFLGLMVRSIRTSPLPRSPFTSGTGKAWPVFPATQDRPLS